MILLSIHSEHASKIISGEKIFEYRKVIPKQEVSHLALYSTAPVKRIVAVVDVSSCIVGSPTMVWKTTSFGSGISKRFFREYFSGRRAASAFSIGNVYEIEEPLPLYCLSGIKAPPQSYCYLNEQDTDKLLKNRAKIPSQEARMIFLGGVHGVGKGTICENIFSPAGYHCLSASKLITEKGRKTDHNKRVSDISVNQSVLISALKNKRKSNNRLLLDGHFTLINDKNIIEPINIEVFRSMNINQLFLVKATADEIAIRLKNRDNRKWKASFIDKFQKEEESHARYVAKDIGVPLRIIRG